MTVYVTAYRPILESTPLRKDPDKNCLAFCLKQADYPQLRALHDTIHAGLHEEHHESYFLPKSEEQLRSCLGDGQELKGNSGMTIGLYVGAQLVGAGTLTYPHAEEDHALIKLPDDLNIHQLGELRSAAIHPDFRGNSLHHVLIKHRLTLLAEMGRTPIIEYDVHNIASWCSSFKHGMKIEYTATDPDDGALLMYALKRLHPADVEDAYIEAHPAEEWDKLQELLQGGYVGMSVTECGRLRCHKRT